MVERKKGFQIAANIIMILLAALCIIPFVLLVMSSVTDESALLKNGYSFFPAKFSFDAYKTLLVDSGSIIRGYIISIFVTIVGTVANLALTTLFAYPLSRKDLPGKGFFAFVIFFTMLFNGGLVPSYMMWTGVFHIKNTLAALIVPNLMMGAFYVIMMRTYFTTNIPDAVLEAARIDGAGEFKILLRVVLPMSKPIIATSRGTERPFEMAAFSAATARMSDMAKKASGGFSRLRSLKASFLPSSKSISSPRYETRDGSKLR